MSPKYRRQNRNVCDLVLIFSQNQRLFFLRVKLYRSPSFKCLWSLLWQNQAVFNFLGRIFKATWRVVVDKLWITPVYASHKATSTRTSKNNIQWWEILPSSDKEITPLKTSFSSGYNLRKRIVLILLTAVDLIRRSTPRYYACCVTRQCLFRIHFFASKRISECPAYLYNYIYLLLPSLLVQMQVVRRSSSLSMKIIYDQVLRDKKKEPAVFWSANLPRFPRQFV